MIRLKLFSLLLPLLLSCLVFAKPTQIDFLISQGYTGSVIILYNQPDGIVPEKAEDGSVIYRIPADGFLKVKPAFERKAYKFGYYYVDGQDRRTPIEYLFPEAYVRDPGDTTSKSHDSITEDERNNGVFIMNHRNTNFNSKDGRVFLNCFSVGKPKDSRDIYIDTVDKTFKIQKEILKTITQP